MYFEDVSKAVLEVNRDYTSMEAVIRLVGWFNLKKINSSLTDADLMLMNVINAIPETYPPLPGATPYLNRIRVMFAGQEPRSADIFGAYSYDEAEKQYLIYPFDYWAINYRILYSVAPSCVPEVEIIPDPC
jgi:hypothetical protein